jgi:hypothetical protein
MLLKDADDRLNSDIFPCIEIEDFDAEAQSHAFAVIEEGDQHARDEGRHSLNFS